MIKIEQIVITAPDYRVDYVDSADNYPRVREFNHPMEVIDWLNNIHGENLCFSSKIKHLLIWDLFPAAAISQ